MVYPLYMLFSISSPTKHLGNILRLPSPPNRVHLVDTGEIAELCDLTCILLGYY